MPASSSASAGTFIADGRSWELAPTGRSYGAAALVGAGHAREVFGQCTYTAP